MRQIRREYERSPNQADVPELLGPEDLVALRHRRVPAGQDRVAKRRSKGLDLFLGPGWTLALHGGRVEPVVRVDFPATGEVERSIGPGLVGTRAPRGGGVEPVGRVASPAPGEGER